MTSLSVKRRHVAWRERTRCQMRFAVVYSGHFISAILLGIWVGSSAFSRRLRRIRVSKNGVNGLAVIGETIQHTCQRPAAPGLRLTKFTISIKKINNLRHERRALIAASLSLAMVMCLVGKKKNIKEWRDRC